MKKYTLGIDYGTESGRVLLVDLSNGAEVASHITTYPHGVINEVLPGTNIRLQHHWALQNPDDYLEVLRQSVPEVVKVSGVNPVDIVGIGIDFTSCTMLPVDSKGIPLCLHPQLKDNPHSWVKLWKHHAAQIEADQITEVALLTKQSFIERYGGKISSEWMFAKIYQILNEAPEIYECADQFLEAVDWVVSVMTGVIVRNSCTAGYKAMWNKQDGYPDSNFFKALDSRLEDVVERKLRGQVIPPGNRAGGLTNEMAQMMGLIPGTAVAAGIIDAHAGMIGTGVVTPGRMVMAMGTSTCHLLLSNEERNGEGICGVVEDGIISGFYGYEAGQPAVGDIFAWFIENAVPPYVSAQAKEDGVSIHAWLEKRAATNRPGASGLIALDWWNGNRSVLMDGNLRGLILGYSLHTKPEEIYRALLEATAFGTRRIIDEFERNGLPVHELYACGGLPLRNRLLMQIYADVTGREIKIAASSQPTALGAAMFGAVAAGSASGGYDHVVEAAEKMVQLHDEVFKPIRENVEVYDQLYGEYCHLYDYFGRGPNTVMKRLSGFARSTSDDADCQSYTFTEEGADIIEYR